MGRIVSSAALQMKQDWEECWIHQVVMLLFRETLREMGDRNLKMFNKWKCKVLHLGKSNPMWQYVLRSNQWDSSSAVNDLGALVNKSIASRLREVFLLSNSQLVKHVWLCPILCSTGQEAYGLTGLSVEKCHQETGVSVMRRG